MPTATSIPLVLAVATALLANSCTGPSPTSTTDADFARRYVDYTYCKVPLARQTSQKSCGAAVLTSVIHYWNETSTVTEPQLTKTYPPESKVGYPLLQLKEIAQQEGVLAFALSMEKDPMNQLLSHLSKGRPVIAALELPKGRYFNDGLPLIETLDRRTINGVGDKTKAHYVVAMGASHDRILLMDPQYGYVDTPKSDFAHFWKAMGYPALVCSEKPHGVKQR